MPALDCEHVGIVVIDCDKSGDVDGEANFRSLCADLRVALDNVPLLRTPRGGTHFYFDRPANGGVRNSAGKIASNVDVRGDGGFVIAPGAVRHDGKAYVPVWPATLKDFIALVRNRQLPPLPDALGRLLFTSRSNIARPALAQPIARPALALPDDISSAELLGGPKPRWSLEQAALEVQSAQEGTRNDALNRMAYVAGLRIAAGELDVDSTYHRLTAAARIAGLDDDEIERTLNAAIDRGWRAGTLQSIAENKMTTWDRTPTRGIKSTFKNAILAVDALGVIARRDMFANKILLANAPGSNGLAPDHLGSLTDNALAFLRKEIQQKIGFDPGADHLHSAITSLAEDARFNPSDGLA